MKKKIIVFSGLFFLFDFFSKILVVKYCSDNIIYIIKNFFSIDVVKNNGAAFSFLSGNVILFILIAVFALIYIFKYVLSNVNGYFELFGIILLIGGILGNLFDRIFYGNVIDFLSFSFFNYQFPVFNFADIFICVGSFLIIIDMLRGDKNAICSK